MDILDEFKSNSFPSYLASEIERSLYGYGKIIYETMVGNPPCRLFLEEILTQAEFQNTVTYQR